MKTISILLAVLLVATSSFGQLSSSVVLKYLEETDVGDTSVVAAKSPNTWISIDDNMIATGDFLLSGWISAGSYLATNGSVKTNYDGDLALTYIYFYEGGNAHGAYLEYDSVANQFSFNQTVVLPSNTYLAEETADSMVVSKKYVDDNAGTTNADSLVHIPIEDTTGNIGEGYVQRFRSATGAMEWEDPPGAAGGEANTLLDTGTYNETSGFGLAGGKTGVALKVKGLIEGSGIEITKSGDSALTITSTAADSVGKAWGDASGNQITATYLPFSGGTLVGNLAMPGVLINEIQLIDVDSGFYMENVEDGGFRTFIEFGLDQMWFGAVSVGLVRERVWQWSLSALTGLTPATLGTPQIGGNVDWKGNPVIGTYIAAQTIKGDHIDSTSEDFVFYEAYKYTSAVNDSAYATEQLVATKVDTTLTDTYIYVGDGTNGATGVDMTGDVSITNAGVTTVASGAVLINEIGNAAADHLISMTTRKLGFVWSAPVDSGMTITATGAFSGQLLHVHQHTGNPTGGTLVHIEADDADILVLYSLSANDSNAVFVGGMVYTDSLTAAGLIEGDSLHVDKYADGSIDNPDLADNAVGVDELATDAVTMDAVDADGDFESLTGNWKTTGTLTGGLTRAEGDLHTEGNLHINTDSTGADAVIYFGDDDEVATIHFDDPNDRIEVSKKLHTADTLYYALNLANPDALYAIDHEWLIPRKDQKEAITIVSIKVELDADPTTELTFSLKFADAFIGFANAVVIDDSATVVGIATITGGFGDATVPADKVIYWLFDADPDDAITQAGVTIGYTVD